MLYKLVDIFERGPHRDNKPFSQQPASIKLCDGVWVLASQREALGDTWACLQAMRGLTDVGSIH